MTGSTTKKSANSQNGSSTSNPFARALAETEKSAFSKQNSQNNFDSNPLGDALSKAGGSFDAFGNKPPKDWQLEQQRQLKKQQEKEALRKKLHDQINPVDRRDLFDAREKEVKKEIEKLKEELQLLAKDVAKFNKDVEISLMSNVVSPGQDGKYYINFFQKLRAFIILLRQKVRSANTWATQMNSKKKKKVNGGAGFNFEGKAGHEKTSMIYEMMHHEVSNARSGG